MIRRQHAYPSEEVVRRWHRLADQGDRQGRRDHALPASSVVLAEDETHLDLLARVRSFWMPAGLLHRILTPGTNVRRTVHGARST